MPLRTSPLPVETDARPSADGLRLVDVKPKSVEQMTQRERDMDILERKEFVRAFFHAAVKAARGIVPADAEDVAQDVLVKLIVMLAAGDFAWTQERSQDRDRLTAWIRRVAGRLAIDRVRKGSRLELVASLELLAETPSCGPAQVLDTTAIREDAVWTEIGRRVEAAGEGCVLVWGAVLEILGERECAGSACERGVTAHAVMKQLADIEDAPGYDWVRRRFATVKRIVESVCAERGDEQP